MRYYITILGVILAAIIGFFIYLVPNLIFLLNPFIKPKQRENQ